MVFEIPIVGELEVSVKSRKYAEFIRRQLVAYYKGSTVSISDSYGIRFFDRNVYALFQKITGRKFRLSRGFSVTEGKIVYKSLEYKLGKDCIEIAKVKQRNNVMRIFVNVLRKLTEVSRYALFHRMFYEEILFPIFSLYSLYGFYLLHGSLLESDDGRHLSIIGLDGVGKSSIALILSKNRWVNMADNFLLTNGEVGIPFNLTIRVDNNQSIEQNVIYKNAALQEINSMSAGKKVVNIDRMFLLYLAEKEISLQKIECKFIDLLEYCLGADEIKDANAFCAPFNLLGRLHNNGNNRDLLSVSLIGVPMGQLDKGVLEIENAIKVVCR